MILKFNVRKSPESPKTGLFYCKNVIFAVLDVKILDYVSIKDFGNRFYCDSGNKRNALQPIRNWRGKGMGHTAKRKAALHFHTCCRSVVVCNSVYRILLNVRKQEVCGFVKKNIKRP